RRRRGARHGGQGIPGPLAHRRRAGARAAHDRSGGHRVDRLERRFLRRQLAPLRRGAQAAELRLAAPQEEGRPALTTPISSESIPKTGFRTSIDLAGIALGRNFPLISTTAL